MSDPEDILALIVKDPKALLKVVQEINTNSKTDANGHQVLDANELANWMVAHADALNVQGHNLGADLKNLGASAARGAKPFHLDDYLYTGTVTDADGTVHRKGDIDQQAMQAQARDAKNFTTLDREVVAITEVIQNALAQNASEIATGTQGMDEAMAKARTVLGQYHATDVHTPGFENLAPLVTKQPASDNPKER